MGESRAEIARLAGTAPDAVVAAKFGVMARDVAALRKQLGVQSFKREEWTTIDSELGNKSDTCIGREFGIPESTIRARRISLGIASYRAHRWAWSLSLDRIFAGPESDAALAAAHGLAEAQVFQRREWLGVGHGGDWRALDWTPEMDGVLGNMPDEQVAAVLGVCRRAVRWRRRALAIKAYKPESDGDSRFANSHAA